MNTSRGQWPEIYTGAYGEKAVAAAVHGGKILPVGIMLYPPTAGRFGRPLALRLAFNLKSLAPNLALFHVEEYARFREPFLDLLEARWSLIEPDLLAIAEGSPGKPLVLLCVERLGPPDIWCHRQIVAEFLETKTGQKVVEFPTISSRLL